MRTNNRTLHSTARRVLVIAACTALMAAMVCGTASAAKWVTLSKYAPAPRPLMMETGYDTAKFYSGQATAFDTYTKKDGYYFALNNARTKMALTHFKQPESPLNVRPVKRVVYSMKQVDHCNGATVYKQGNETYLFVAKGGEGNPNACMIKLSDFNKGKAKVYSVKFKNLDTVSGNDMRGITYCGKRTITVAGKKIKKEVFVAEVGRRMNLCYLSSLTAKSATFVAVDSQRFKAPMIGKREGTAQGVTYHNGYLYLAYGDENKKAGGQYKTGFVERVAMNKLFAGNKPSEAKRFPQSMKLTYEKNATRLYVPEAIYFTSLNGKTNMFLTTNDDPFDGSYSYIDAEGDPVVINKSNNPDWIYKSTQKF